MLTHNESLLTESNTMHSLASDKSNPSSPLSSLKGGKRQSKRREAIFDAFRSLQHQLHHEESRLASPSASVDDIDTLNASAVIGTTRSHQRQSHSRTKSFFLGSSSSKKNAEPNEEKEEQKSTVHYKLKHGKGQERVSYKTWETLQQASDMVCLKADASVMGNMTEEDRSVHLWNEKKIQMERQEREELEYSSLYSQILLPTNVSSQRHRTTTIASTQSGFEGSIDSHDSQHTRNVPSPLPPKRTSRRKRAQSSFGAIDATPIISLHKDDHSKLLSDHRQSIPRDGTESSHSHSKCESTTPPYTFGIVSESSHSFKSLAALPLRRGEASSATHQRKGSVCSSNGSGGGGSNSLSASPDSFTSASSQWAGSTYSNPTMSTPGLRSRSSSIATSNASSELWSSANKVVEEENHPLPPIPVRFLTIDNSEVLKTPTFGCPPDLSNESKPSPSMQSTVSNSTTVYDKFPACSTGVERISHIDSMPRNHHMQSLTSKTEDIYLSERVSSRSDGAAWGLGLSHVKLALAKDIRPLRKETLL